MSTHNIITPEMIGKARDELMRPLSEAQGLPGRFYGEDFYRLEQERLFPRHWCAVTLGARVPNPGDMAPIDVAGWQILIVRTRSGGIRAYHNVCRHRGIRLVSEPQSGSGRIRCPWHSWIYTLDGALIGTPELGGAGVNDVEGFDKAQLGLKPILVGRWLDYVFVNIDGQAGPFADYIRPIQALFSDYDLDGLRPAMPISDRYEGNWKLATEGGIEDYHLTFGHPQIEAHLYRNSTPCHVVPSYTGGWTEVAESQTDDAPSPWTARLPSLKTRAGRPLPRLYALNLFPTGTLLVAGDHVMQGVLLPDGSARTRVELHLYFDNDKASAAEWDQARRGTLDMWMEVLPQDRPFVAAAQAALATRDAVGVRTRFSPYWEDGVRRFQQMVLDAVS
jgi:choline monooxygenase